jgi:hypothetical protein
MPIAFRLLILLIGLSPAFLVADSLVVHGALAAYVTVMVGIVAWSIRPGEAVFLSTIIAPAIFLALVVAAWIVIQAIPFPFNVLRHPIWISAEAAVGKSLWDSISASPGDTLIALSRYCSACGLFLVATAASIDRQRAETILLWLAGIATLMALLLIIHDLGGFVFLGEISSVGVRASVTSAATLSTVLTSATVIYAIERYETRRGREDFGRHAFIFLITAVIGALLISWIAVALFTSKPAIFAAASGVGTLLLIVGFRRIGLGSQMGFVLAGVIVAVPLSVIAPFLFAKVPDLSIRFVADAPKSFLDLTQRIITDTNWTGSGAGTFAVLLPIYQDPNDQIAAASAPTTAAALVIELGRPSMWAAIAAALAVIAWLVRGALQRGRDSFFTAAGASCAVVLALEAFVDASLLTSATIVIAMTVLGLALSQSVSRSAR